MPAARSMIREAEGISLILPADPDDALVLRQEHNREPTPPERAHDPVPTADQLADPRRRDLVELLWGRHSATSCQASASSPSGCLRSSWMKRLGRWSWKRLPRPRVVLNPETFTPAARISSRYDAGSLIEPISS